MLITILLVIGIIISIIINIFLFKALSNQLKKVKFYENWVDENNDWIITIYNDIRDTYLKMKSVDDRGLFSKDDDVGFVFTELITLLKKLNDRIQK